MQARLILPYSQKAISFFHDFSKMHPDPSHNMKKVGKKICTNHYKLWHFQPFFTKCIEPKIRLDESFSGQGGQLNCEISIVRSSLIPEKQEEPNVFETKRQSLLKIATFDHLFISHFFFRRHRAEFFFFTKGDLALI